MTWPNALRTACALALAAAASANAQTRPSKSSEAPQSGGRTDSSSGSTRDFRFASTTFLGDTGLWFVPTAEVLAHGKWSVSGYRRGTNFVQGFTNVGDFAGTVAVGVRDRAELFASFLADTRIDRDLRPLFSSDAVGGLVDRYPFARSGWSGDNPGDLYVGAKINLLSEHRQHPAALAVRAVAKLPTGDDEAGVSTGKADFLVQAIVSKEAGRLVELSGYGGYEVRGQPSTLELPSGAFHWGGGAGFPSRSPLRALLEVNGIVPSDDQVVLGPSVARGSDGSFVPISSSVESLTRATVGATWQHRGGFFVGGGVSWNIPRRDRDRFGTDGDAFGDFIDWQVRIGFHPGTRVYVPPAPPPTTPPAAQSVVPPPPPVIAPQNRPPTVKAQCDPCTVREGASATVRAEATDPDGDPLTYRWSAPSGVLATPTERASQWTGSMQEGAVPVTVTVSDGRGGTATDTVNIQVTRPPTKRYTFEDVHFDFDRFTLRAEATKLLDDAAQAMREDGQLRLEIEGHTCNIGTAEYNLALGDRRANAVRDYLVSRGVAVDRLRTISYGEERPKHDNTREVTRRLNRRAALVVNLTR